MNDMVKLPFATEPQMKEIKNKRQKINHFFHQKKKKLRKIPKKITKKMSVRENWNFFAKSTFDIVRNHHSEVIIIINH